MKAERLAAAKRWMKAHNITYRAIAHQLGMSIGGSHDLIVRDTITTKRHAQLVALGFPVEILPTPLDKPLGVRPKEPDFPGLRNQV